jgi:hypothetical protein
MDFNYKNIKSTIIIPPARYAVPLVDINFRMVLFTVSCIESAINILEHGEHFVQIKEQFTPSQTKRHFLLHLTHIGSIERCICSDVSIELPSESTDELDGIDEVTFLSSTSKQKFNP